MDRHLNNLRKLIKSATFKQSFVSFGGTFLTGILGVIFYIIVARNMGPETYGSFSVSVTILALVASIANLGTDTGVIRFVAGNLHKDKNKALSFLKLALLVKLAISFVVILLGWFLSPAIANLLLHKAQLAPYVFIAFIGASGMMLFSLGTSSLQAFSKFFIWSVVNVGSNLLRLILVVLLIVGGILTVTNTLTIYIVVLFIWFFISLFFLPHYWKVKYNPTLLKPFMQYNLWIAAFSILSASASRIDTFLITRYLTLTDVGIYAVAVSLSGFVSQIVLAFGSVIAPKLAAMSKKEMIVYLGKIQLFVIFLAIVGLIVGIPAGVIGIPLLYGQEYTSSILPFGILLVSQAIFLVSTPVHSTIIYHYSYPRFFVYVTAINAVIVFVGGYILLPMLGYSGMAISVLVGTVGNLIIPTVWLIRRMKHDNIHI